MALMIARVSPNKRHDLILNAAQVAKSQVPNLFLVFNGEVFGESPSYDSVQEFIEGQSMQEWVKIIPFTEDVRETHSLADLFVLCSEREGFGQCVIEAMSMEVPVIVAGSGALPEIVRHGQTGFVVPPGDAHALARQIVAAFAQPDIGRAIVPVARRHVEREFNICETVRKVTAIYELLLGRRAAPAAMGLAFMK